MTCTDFQAKLLPDFLEQHGLLASERAAADAHLAACAECAALVADLRTIVRDAGELPVLTPGRELWSGIEARIEAPVVALPTRSGRDGATVSGPPVAGEGASAVAGANVGAGATSAAAMLQWRDYIHAAPWRRYAIAAFLLVAVTAGVTWQFALRASVIAVVPDSALVAASTGGSGLRRVSRPGAAETFDREIASLRKLVDERRSELDPITVGIVEKNLKLIDRAISESKAALANDPANAFLSDRLTHAYDNKLQLMRELATRPPHS